MKKEILTITKQDDSKYAVEFENGKTDVNYLFVPDGSDSKKLKLAIRKFSTDDNAQSKILDLSDKKFKTILENTFTNDSYITEIKLPTSLMTIEKSAFKNCKSLKVVQFENIQDNSFITIQSQAFKDCEKLESVIFGETASFKKITIEKGAFEGCSSLRTVYLNSTDCVISEGAFSDADNLVFAVKGNSSAARYAREHGIKYVRF